MGVATEVGSVNIKVRADTRQFEKQMNGMGKLATKLGGKIAAALGTAALIKFGKSCIDLASDLNEVQNVVDVTFPRMAAQADKFAKSAADMYGLSETMAKRYLGTFGSMAEAFGFSEKKAYQMSEALTGLAGDVSSFYNISQDAAYTKLKSVFSGETESLKDLGVVMTQAALDQFALANGFGKTTKAMTEQEKVSLRLAFVTNSLKNASGDFARTSDSWANSIKILQLRFESFKASVGQVLIIAFTPVIRLINTLMLGITALADKFVKFMSAVTGKSFGNASSAAKQMAINMGNASNSAAGIGKSTKTAANNTNKAQKAAAKLKRTLMGFDRINKLEKKDKASKTPSAGTENGAGIAVPEMNTAAAGADNLQKKLKKIELPPALQKALDKLKGSFMNLVNTVKPAGKWLMDNILKPLGKWTVNKLAPKLVEVLAAAFEVLAAAIDVVATVLNDILKPIWLWLWKNVLSKIAKIIGKVIIAVLEMLAEDLKSLAKQIGKLPAAIKKGVKIVKELATTLKKNLLKIIEKVKEKIDAFVKVWNGIKNKAVELVAEAKEKVEGALAALFVMWENIKDRAATLLAEAKEKVNGALAALAGAWEGIKDRTASLVAEAKEKASGTINELKKNWESITDRTAKLFAEIASKWDDLKNSWNNIVSNIQDKTARAFMAVGNKWNDIKTKWTDITKNINDLSRKASMSVKTKWDDIKDNWKSVTKNINSLARKASMSVKTKWDDIKDDWKNVTKNINSLGRQATMTVKTKWNDIKSDWKNLTKNIQDQKKKVELTVSATLVNTKKFVNGLIDKINSKLYSLTLPKALGGGHVFKKNVIPHLAEGGFVKKNTPQLAVIGDNRHEGEVVAPESKLESMAAKAAAMAGNGDMAEVESLLRQILQTLNAMDTNVYMDGKQIKNRIVALINADTKATGRCAVLT